MKTNWLIFAGLMSLILSPAIAAQSGLPDVEAVAKAAAFAPLSEWKTAILSGDRAVLAKMFSSEPAAVVQTPEGDKTAKSEVEFWALQHTAGLQALNLEVVNVTDTRPDIWQVVFQAELVGTGKPTTASSYVIERQMWAKQGSDWKLAGVRRTALTKLQQPTSKGPDLYAHHSDAHAEIKKAVGLAKAAHKRVLVVFGADWCYDCHVLDKAFHRGDVAPTLEANFEVVHVDIGKGDLNQDLMKNYQVPMERGIPAIAVLDDEGKLLFSQKGGEFESARALAPSDILAFLDKWKPGGWSGTTKN